MIRHNIGHPNKHVESQKLEEIKIYSLTRAELIYPICNEIPCIRKMREFTYNLRQL